MIKFIKKNFIPIIVFGFLFFIVFNSLWVSFTIIIGAKQTSGVITKKLSHGVVEYKYTVNGVEYLGYNQPPRDMIVFKTGDKVEVKYSTLFPKYATLTSPWEFPGQLLFLICFIGFISFVVWKGKK